MPLLNADQRHPMRFPDGSENLSIVHLNQVIDHPNIQIGDYTYANDFDPPTDPSGWAARLAPYTYPGAPERLIIGRYGQIAHGVRFITASANHPMGGLTTFPFQIFDPASLPQFRDSITGLPDTIIGHDCWIGHGALILPGARLGHGIIVGAGAVVGGTVADYAVVVGNPARTLRMRFAPGVIARLLASAWWDWPPEKVTRNLSALTGDDPAGLAGAL